MVTPMRIWTTQPLSFWNQLKEQGVARCDASKSYAASDENFKVAYDWLVTKMVERIGPPPSPDIVYPVWGWAQVGSNKKEYHGSMFDTGSEEDEFVFITAEIPDHLVLLSDYMWWHCVLNLTYADNLRHTKYGPGKDMAVVVKTWDNIFDLHRRGHGFQAYRNRCIQATFWELRLEWVTATTRYKGCKKWHEEDLRRSRESEKAAMAEEYEDDME